MTEKVTKKEARQGRSDGHVWKILAGGLVLMVVAYAIFEIFMI